MKKILTILFALGWLIGQGQTYDPSKATTSNKPYGMAQFGPTDSRSYFYDAANFVWRPYVSTAEVLSYLNLSKYRSGQVLYVVNTGGTLLNGVITGGTNALWFFKDGQADVNLVQLVTGGGGSGTVTSVSSTAGGGITLNITNPTTTPNITPSVTIGGDITGATLANMTVAKFNGQLPSFYLNYLNLFNTPTIPAQFNPIAGTGISLSGSYPNITFTNTGIGFTTAGVYMVASGGGTVINYDTANHPIISSITTLNDSTVLVTYNNRVPDTLSIRGGAGGGGGGSGTVVSFSFTNANGISGVVTNPTSTPNLTLTLGAITPTSVNGLTLAAISNGFTITGGSGTPRTLTVNAGNANVSGTNTGDVILAGENYLSIAGQVITANAVNVSGTNITGILKAASFPAMLGDVTNSAGSLTNVIGANVVTNAKLAQMAAHTFKGNNTGSTANALDLTATQLTAELNVFTSSLKGLAPASGGGTVNFLRADGTWTTPPSATPDTLYVIKNGTGLSGAYANTAGDTLKVPSWTAGTNITITGDSSTGYTINASGGGSLSGYYSVRDTIPKTTHGFVVGDIVGIDSSAGTSPATWSKANLTTIIARGVVSEVINANSFIYTSRGPMNWASGFGQGLEVYSHASTAGAGTVTSPAISIPIGVQRTSGIFYVDIQRGFNFSATAIGLTTNHILVGNASGAAADVAMSGDATIVASGSLTIANNAVTNAKLAQMTAHTYKGNNTGATTNAADITNTQLTADLNLFTTSLQGLVPGSGGGTTNFLRADGTWAAPPGGGGGVTGITSPNGTILVAGTTSITIDVAHPQVRTTTTVTGNTSLSLSTGDYIAAIWVDPTSATTGFQVGTTSTGSDIINSTNLLAASKNNFFVGYRASAATTLFFQNISSSTIITLIKFQ